MDQALYLWQYSLQINAAQIEIVSILDEFIFKYSRIYCVTVKSQDFTAQMRLIRYERRRVES